ncbi:tubulin folding cofactor D C terminal-domain-containing protein [Dimargaris cristalligena]|uniref:Tubulin folding cofactor D C terminal-domain-containing protein n=1 Tax=Dimargaris cristalligena TaxID=215637 RepID=A0A4P9ZLB1_9FUNG|nr:tubulin folding cofactor D C terminal-domain-containing protein [Dimargaris cristalligena]|eukprot:RKP33271.1 tubulin folding cofactor D C terminal-domain-containing protein [Dimargaris cristalligena]
MTKADYFSLSNIQNAFLKVSVEVAEYPEYAGALLAHLYSTTMVHWDARMRDLAGEAVALLVPFAVEAVVNAHLPQALKACQSTGLIERHGGLVVAGATYRVLAALASARTESIPDLSSELVELLTHIPTGISPTYLADFGSDITWAALCDYIGQILQANWHSVPASLATPWVELLESVLARPEGTLHTKACEALYWYYRQFSQVSASRLVTYCQHLEPGQPPSTRRGFCLALGSFQLAESKEQGGQVIRALESLFVDPTKAPKSTVELKENALIVLRQLFIQLAESTQTAAEYLTADQWESIFRILIPALNDYTTDNRGDVGSHVRKAATELVRFVLPQVPELLLTQQPVLVECHRQIISTLIRLVFEKMDRLRIAAGDTLAYLLYGYYNVPQPDLPLKDRSSDGEKEDTTPIISAEPQVAYPAYLLSDRRSPCLVEAGEMPNLVGPQRSSLLEAIPQAGTAAFYWDAPAQVLARMSQLVHTPSFRRDVILGLLISTGSPLDHLRGVASASFIQILVDAAQSASAPPAETEAVAATTDPDTVLQQVTELLTEYNRDDRIVHPIYSALNVLTEAGALNTVSVASLAKLLVQIRKENYQTRDTKRLTSTVAIYSHLLSHSSELRAKILPHLLGFLAHPFPVIRQAAADHLYMSLCFTVLYPRPEDLEFESYITDTAWKQPTAQTRAVRMNLYDYLQVPKPVVAPKKA